MHRLIDTKTSSPVMISELYRECIWLCTEILIRPIFSIEYEFNRSFSLSASSAGANFRQIHYPPNEPGCGNSV